LHTHELRAPSKATGTAASLRSHAPEMAIPMSPSGLFYTLHCLLGWPLHRVARTVIPLAVAETGNTAITRRTRAAADFWCRLLRLPLKCTWELIRAPAIGGGSRRWMPFPPARADRNFGWRNSGPVASG
jgi:hypothetical protein